MHKRKDNNPENKLIYPMVNAGKSVVNPMVNGSKSNVATPPPQKSKREDPECKDWIKNSKTAWLVAPSS
jgi:hypothetical protein